MSMLRAENKSERYFLQEDGKERRLKQAVSSRIVLVLDTAGGRRNWRNLWGFRPVTQQTLYLHDEAALSERPGLFVSGLPLVPKTWIAGREFRFNPPLGEELVREVMGKFGDVRPGSVTQRFVVQEKQGQHEKEMDFGDGYERSIAEWSVESLGIKFRRTGQRVQWNYGRVYPEEQKTWWEVKLADPK